jgi:cytochrome oxidase Cu insertion factor (SCO1/SenC/PrrC family)
MLKPKRGVTELMTRSSTSGKSDTMRTFQHFTKTSLSACLLTFLFVSLHAQRASQEDTTREGMVGNFNRSAPAIGEKIPFLEGVDANGNPWNTDQLKGRHTVLVFGCLT